MSANGDKRMQPSSGVTTYPYGYEFWAESLELRKMSIMINFHEVIGETQSILATI